MPEPRRAYRDRFFIPASRARLQRLLAPVMPYYRLVRRGTEYWWARRRVERRPGGDRPPVAFVLGSGRSGTTLVGALLADHPEVDYIFEPWHLWAAINPLTDANRLYVSAPGRVFMDDSLWDPAQTRRFEALILQRRRDARLVVEKSPVNALRIGWLEALTPGAKYINLLRDGGQVAQSISLICDRPPYRVGRKRVIDQWWGLDHAKWQALAADGAAAGYCPDELGLLSSGYQKGAYEWLVSVAEVERLRPALGERVMDLRLDRLCADPANTIRELAGFLGLSVERAWVERGVAAVGPLLNRALPPLLLPPGMARSFNERQAGLGFPTRAEAATGEAQ